MASSILLFYKLIFIHHNIACDSNVSFDQDVEYPMNACLSPEPSHVSLPINPRFDVLAGDNNLSVVITCLAMLAMIS